MMLFGVLQNNTCSQTLGAGGVRLLKHRSECFDIFSRLGVAIAERETTRSRNVHDEMRHFSQRNRSRLYRYVASRTPGACSTVSAAGKKVQERSEQIRTWIANLPTVPLVPSPTAESKPQPLVQPSGPPNTPHIVGEPGCSHSALGWI